MLRQVSSFNKTEQKSNEWLKDVMKEMSTDDPERAFRAFRAVTHALRDRLSVEEAIDLSSEFPVFLKGVYLQGWNPYGKPLVYRRKADFLAYVASEYGDNPTENLDAIVESVFRVLAKRISEGEFAQVLHCLPERFRPSLS